MLHFSPKNFNVMSWIGKGGGVPCVEIGVGFKGSEAVLVVICSLLSVKQLDDGVLLEELTKPSLGKDSCLYCDEASASFSEDSVFFRHLPFPLDL